MWKWHTMRRNVSTSKGDSTFVSGHTRNMSSKAGQVFSFTVAIKMQWMCLETVSGNIIPIKTKAETGDNIVWTCSTSRPQEPNYALPLTPLSDLWPIDVYTWGRLEGNISRDSTPRNLCENLILTLHSIRLTLLEGCLAMRVHTAR
jgi:hypothetical protein